MMKTCWDSKLVLPVKKFLGEHQLSITCELASLTDTEFKEIFTDSEVHQWLVNAYCENLFPGVREEIKQEVIAGLEKKIGYHRMRQRLANSRIESLTEETELERDRQLLLLLKR
jgi:hypothetical protein